MSATEWQLSRHGDRCAACARPFEVGEPFQAALLGAEAGGFERRDHCLNCVPPPLPRLIGTWRTKRTPGTAKAATFDREAVFEFFQRLDGAAEPEKQQFRFALALLLWRKKALKFNDSIAAGGGEIWNFTSTKDGGVHPVSRPDLSEDQIEHLSQELESMLSGGGFELTSESPQPAVALQHGNEP